MRLAVVGVSAWQLLSGGVCVAQTTIGFDDLPGGTVVSTNYQGLGIVVTGNLRVVGPSAFTNPVSPPNSSAFLSPVNQELDYTIRIDFVVPGTSTPGVTDFVAYTPTDASNGNTVFTLRAFDSEGTLLDTATRGVDSNGIYNPSVDTEVSVSAGCIAYVEMTVTVPGPGNRVLEGDDLRFNTPVVPVDCPGDTNCDLAVDFLDLNVLLNNWQKPDAARTQGDVTGDGAVDFSDLNVMLDAFGDACV